jgi:hypothetical protein
LEISLRLCADGSAETVCLFKGFDEGGCCILEIGYVLASMVLKRSCRGGESGLCIRNVGDVIIISSTTAKEGRYLFQVYRRLIGFHELVHSP